MVKRLRGWQLEKEMEKPPGNLEKGTKSQLATALLSLWAHGKVSGRTMRWLAECALQDGAQHDELVLLAKCGSHGVHPGNIHRDLMASFCKGIDLPDPFHLEVPCKNPKTLKKDSEVAAIYLPHLMFAKLATYSKFETIFPLELLEQFWDQAEKTGDDRLQGHPMKVKGWKKKTIPLFLHGDGVEYQSRDSLMVYSWGSLLQQLNSLSSHFMIGGYPKSCAEASAWDTMMKWICWSFAALEKGLHPTHDPAGNPLKKDSPFYLEKGKPLCNGLKGVLWCIQGDHEFFSNALLLPHWASHYPCWECDAQKEPKPVKLWYKTLEKGKQGFTLVSNEEARLHPRSNHPLFSGVIGGLTTKMVRGDCLHILFCKGVLGHFLGSIMHYLCWHDGPGKVQAVAPEKRLGAMFEAIQREYVRQSSPTRVTNLRLSMICDPKQPHASFAHLDLKAAETKHILHAFLPVCKALLDEGVAEEKAMLQAMQCMSKLIKLFDEADAFLTEAEWHKAMSLEKGFSDYYALLSAWAPEKGRKLFNIVMKCHTFQHLVANSKYLNPKTHWTFSSEDFVGKISLLTSSVSPGVSSTRLSVKVAPKYRILLHFLLTREGMELASRQIDP